MRPTIGYYTVNTNTNSINNINNYYLNSTDKAAYYCTSNAAAQNFYLSNFINSGTGTDNFILDYNPLTNENFLNVSLISERNETLFQSDPGNHLLVTFSTPADLPIGSFIRFTSGGSLLTSLNTLCAIENVENGIVKTLQCTITGGQVSCPVNVIRDMFSICCQNVQGTDPTVLNTVEGFFPPNPNIADISTYVSSLVFSAQSPTTFFTYTPNLAMSPGISTIEPEVKGVTYMHVTQEDGLGLATFEIDLGRSLTSNMIITLQGDMTLLKIQDITAFCRVGFGSKYSLGPNFDDGSGLIDGCFVDLTSTTNPVKVYLKKRIFKCGLEISSSLNITLWPIHQLNYTNITNAAQKEITVAINLIDGNDALAANNKVSALVVSSLSTPPTTGNSMITDLCDMNVYPTVPDEYSALLINFDMSRVSTTGTSTSINELTIFFPEDIFGRLFLDTILCMINNTILNCYWEEPNILNVYASSFSIDSSINKIELKLYNILTPASDSTINFACSLNNYNDSTYQRVNIANGTGKLLFGIKNSPAVSGYLRFLNTNIVNNTVTSDTNPRAISTHTFHIAIDNASNNVSQNISINNIPYLMITFPNEYKLTINSLVENNNSELTGISNLFNSDNNATSSSSSQYPRGNKSNMTVEVYQYSISTVTPGEEVKSTENLPVTFYQEGNNVLIYFSQGNISFDKDSLYLEVIISNIINPNDTTNTSYTQTTGMFKALLTNLQYSYMFRTYSNTNTYSSDLLGQALNSWLVYNRGFNFNFDNKKWIVDVNTQPVLNRTSLLPGRYKQLFFKNKANDSVLMFPASTDISIDNKNFQLNESYITMPSSLFYEKEFYIGCNCSTVVGKYLIYFKSTNSDITVSSEDSSNGINALYTYVVPLVADIAISKGTIDWAAPETVVSGGTTYIFYTLSERTFEEISINWSTNPKSQINDTTIKTFANSGRTVFSLTDSAELNTQNFTPTPLNNNCFTYTKNTLSFRIEGVAANIPNGALNNNDFSYFNFDTDPFLKKNSIRFTYNSVYRPVYIHCALICFNREYPTDEEIIKEAQALATDQISYSDSTLLYYSAFIYENTIDPYSITFNNLLRSERYKLKCIIEPTQFNTTQRTKSVVEIEQLQSSDGRTNSFIANSPSLTKCAEVHFSSNPSNQTKTLLLYYCQHIYSNPGYPVNGCVICTDLFGNKAPGLRFPDTSSCSGTNYVFKQYISTTSTDVTSGGSSPDKYAICPVAGLNCETDVSGVEDFNGLFSRFIDNIKTPAEIKVLLDISGVPVTHIDEYDDSLPPALQQSMGVDTTTAKQNGFVSFKLFYPTPLQCFFQIDTRDRSDPPLFIDIQSCTNKYRCGFTLANKEGYFMTINTDTGETQTVRTNTISTDSSINTEDTPGLMLTEEGNRRRRVLNLRKLQSTNTTDSNTTNTTDTNTTKSTNGSELAQSPEFPPALYQIWVACYNDIPYPLQRSEVHSVFNFLIEEDFTCTGTNANNTECQNNNTIPDFSLYLSPHSMLMTFTFFFVLILDT